MKKRLTSAYALSRKRKVAVTTLIAVPLLLVLGASYAFLQQDKKTKPALEPILEDANIAEENLYKRILIFRKRFERELTGARIDLQFNESFADYVREYLEKKYEAHRNEVQKIAEKLAKELPVQLEIKEVEIAFDKYALFKKYLNADYEFRLIVRSDDKLLFSTAWQRKISVKKNSAVFFFADTESKCKIYKKQRKNTLLFAIEFKKIERVIPEPNAITAAIANIEDLQDFYSRREFTISHLTIRYTIRSYFDVG